MRMDDLVLLKLGGSVLTEKDKERKRIRRRVLNRVCKEIAEALDTKEFRLIIVHGAGPFGHIPAKRYSLFDGLKSSKQLRGFVLTRCSMEELNDAVVNSLVDAGVNAVAYQPSAVGTLRDKRLCYFPTRVLKKLLDLGVVPVSYGDVLVDEEIGLSILSGDQLTPYLAKALKASRIIFATDVGGVYDRDPKEDKNAKLIKEITSANIDSISISGSKATDVTGGMYGKIKELLDLAEYNIESEVVSALKPNILKKALLGERGLGTLIKR